MVSNNRCQLAFQEDAVRFELCDGLADVNNTLAINKPAQVRPVNTGPRGGGGYKDGSYPHGSPHIGPCGGGLRADRGVGEYSGNKRGHSTYKQLVDVDKWRMEHPDRYGYPAVNPKVCPQTKAVVALLGDMTDVNALVVARKSVRRLDMVFVGT